MDWLWLVGGALVLLALLLVLNWGRPALTRSLPWINYGGKQGPDVSAMRVLEDEVTRGASVRIPKDPAP